MFNEQLAYGREAEFAVHRWLMQERGWYIMPVYDMGIEDKSPRFFGAHNHLVLPDIFASRDGEVRWVEIKHKTYFSWYRIGGYWVTGIGQRHYEHYQQVQVTTGIPVWLMFLHDRTDSHEGKCPVGLFAQTLTHLVTCESHHGKSRGASMVYWQYENLKQLATLKQIEAYMEPSNDKQ